MTEYVKTRVFVAAEVDPLLIERLKRDPHVELMYEPVASELALAERLAQVEVLVTRYHNRVTARVLSRAPALRLIVQGTSGIDNVDLAAAQQRGITVLTVPGENANAVAEWVIAMSIHLTRSFPLYDRSVREGKWLRDDCATRRELRGHRLGIVGIGRVGGRVATLARSFGLEPIAYDPYVPADEVTRRGATKIDSLEALLCKAELLTLHVPLTDETRRMIAAPQLDLLPVGAIVLNASRGAVLDLEALLDRLGRGHLGGAALDVFEQEPPPRRGWPSDPRLILTPHIAGCSRESKESIGALVYQKICEFCGWEPA